MNQLLQASFVVSKVLVFLALFTPFQELGAQVSYDTIPERIQWIGSFFPEEYPAITDIEGQGKAYFEKVDFSLIDCHGERVFVRAMFGKEGVLTEIQITKSASPTCDSIAFFFVKGLDNWLPGLQRGRFVDVPINFPVILDSIAVFQMLESFQGLYGISNEDYAQRKEYFDFTRSSDPDYPIIPDYRLFRSFVAENLGKGKYVHVNSNYRHSRRESAILEIEVPNPKQSHVLVWNPSKNWILNAYDLRKRKKIRVPKDTELFLMVYEEGTEPLLQAFSIENPKDENRDIAPVPYTKGQLMETLEMWKK